MEHLVELLETSARRFASSPALLMKPGLRYQTWSYARLWEDSGRVAALLAQRGVTKGDRVIIWAPNRPEWVVAFFGSLRAGATVVPLDLRSAADFVERIVEQTSPTLAFVARQTPEALHHLGIPQLWLEDLTAPVRAGGLSVPLPEVSGDDLAEIMFTSGTTGQPKGVMLTHRNIVANVQATEQIQPALPSYRLLSLLPLSHMLEQNSGLLLPLLGGASVAYPTSRQPSVLFRTLRECRVTTLVLVPQALQLFMHAIEREVARQGKQGQWAALHRAAGRLPFWARRLLFRSVLRQFGGRLQFFVVGGAYLDPALAQRWENMGVAVLQGYGATEASPIVTGNTLVSRRLDSLGKVLPGQEVKLAPDGEIWTRGANVTAGYWQNPDQTAAAFEDGWYKTGDLGVLDAEGFLYFKGRKKDIIVLANGQNVFPEDIENVLRQCSGVTDAVVVGVPKGAGEVETHAVLLTEPDADGAAIVREANRRLAAHQQIIGFTRWPEDDFPRTHTLKVRKHLVLERIVADLQGVPDTAPKHAPAAARQAAAPAATDFQRLVASVCSVPLGEVTPEKVLATDLGLDSLGRVGLLSAIEEEFGVYVDDEQLTPESTVGDLEQLLGMGPSARVLAFSEWPRRIWFRTLRAALQTGLVLPFTRVFYKVDIAGTEHLRELEGPVLFAANHTADLDNACILMAVGHRWRWQLAIAAAADDIFGDRWRGNLAALLGNAFPLSREGAVRSSLEHLGKLLDGGWSVLIYPEGELTVGGPMKPFKAGAGMVAVESQAPVIPVKVNLERWGLFDSHTFRSWFSRGYQRNGTAVEPHPAAPRPRVHFRGKIRIRIGKPMLFPAGMPYLEATDKLEETVRNL